MNSGKGYIIFIVILLGITMALLYRMPQKFIWSPTFHHLDKQPFGAALFDDIVEASVPDYSISNLTFYQLNEDSISNTAILAVGEYLQLDRVDVESLYEILDRGNKVMLVANRVGYELGDTLNLDYSYQRFSLRELRDLVRADSGKDTIKWQADEQYAARSFYAYKHIMGPFFERYDSLAAPLAVRDLYYKEDLKPVALRYTIGSGELYVVSTPLLFTNYGILDGDNSDYVFRLLSQMKGMPLVRTQGYNIDMTASQTPLRYFLSQPPLQWGIYVTMLLILTFMIFTARRRQRVIPVVAPPENKSVEFVELIGTLYFQKKDHADLVRKKYLYFADALRRQIQVDLDDEQDDKEHARRIHQKTGIDEDKIHRLLISLRRVLEDDKAYITEDLMKKYIDRINGIVTSI